jgi:hypothetical protein
LTPSLLSSASSRLPIIAGAIPSALAAADRLPRATTSTKVEISLNLPIFICLVPASCLFASPSVIKTHG